MSCNAKSTQKAYLHLFFFTKRCFKMCVKIGHANTMQKMGSPRASCFASCKLVFYSRKNELCCDVKCDFIAMYCSSEVSEREGRFFFLHMHNVCIEMKVHALQHVGLLQEGLCLSNDGPMWLHTTK